MGYSISEATHNKIERNRAEGRLCAGSTHVRHGCTTRAGILVKIESWTYKIGEGKSQINDLPMCFRHGTQHPDTGVNFKTISKTIITKDR